jgi:butyryl-CoA dehydrogenase
VAEHQQVHMLFNNAGVTTVDQVESISYEDFNWVMNINFWGVVYGTKAFIAHLQQADEAHIINTSSLFGLISSPRQSAYNASKFAVRGFTESLKMELAKTNVRVSCVHPGGIKTSIIENARVHSENADFDKKALKETFDKMAPTTAAQAASIILDGVSKNKRRIVVGKDARIADRIARWFPNSYEKILKLENR